MEPPTKRQKRAMSATELILYMTWREAWYVRGIDRKPTGSVSISRLFGLMKTTADYLKLEVKLPDERQFVHILDRLCLKGIVSLRPVKGVVDQLFADQPEETHAFMSDAMGQKMEDSLLKAAEGEQGSLKVTEHVRRMHAQFLRRDVWTSLGKELSQEQIAGLMKQASDE